MRNSRLVVLVGAVSIGSVALAGCSQIDSLQQVSGVPINTLQIAIGYELMDKNVPILVVPVCVEDTGPGTFECKGKTTMNQPILVTASKGVASTFTLSPGGTPTPAADGTLDMTMVIKVGGKQIYSGEVQTVIDRNQRLGK